ncbi:MAG: hypothetical protein ACLFUB_16350 [Cyclobacteriaceae bacterium]
MMPKYFDFAYFFNNKEPLSQRKQIYDKYSDMYRSLLYKKAEEQHIFPHPIYKKEYSNNDFLDADGFYVGDPKV